MHFTKDCYFSTKNNKVPSTLQYNVWSLFRSHLTDANSKSTSPSYNQFIIYPLLIKKTKTKKHRKKKNTL